ncbi:MAG: hypothetical protein ACHQ53_08625 [Polyangiales bacterium]
MRQAAMLRFLELLCKEIGAVDARAELGGRDPDDPRSLFINLPGGFRLVALFEAAPEDRAEKQSRLEQLAQGFSHTVGETALGSLSPSIAPDSPYRRLDAALEALRTRSGAVSVAVLDVQSPVLWGSSEHQRHTDDVEAMVQIGQALRATLEAGITLDAICSLQADDVPARLRDLGVDPDRASLLGGVLSQRDETALRHHLLTCLAVARARGEAQASPGTRWAHHEMQFGYFVRGFANIYLLINVFEGAFSELYVESAVVHALPAIEQLLLALPPLDPGPVAQGGRVIRMRRR